MWWDALVATLDRLFPQIEAGQVRRLLVDGTSSTFLKPQAADVAVLGAAKFNAGETVPPDQAAPVYLRNQVAAKPASRKS